MGTSNTTSQMKQQLVGHLTVFFIRHYTEEIKLFTVGFDVSAEPSCSIFCVALSLDQIQLRLFDRALTKRQRVLSTINIINTSCAFSVRRPSQDRRLLSIESAYHISVRLSRKGSVKAVPRTEGGRSRHPATLTAHYNSS